VWSAFPLYTVFFAYKLWATVFLVLSLAHEAEARGLSPVRVLLGTLGFAYGVGLSLLSILFVLSSELVTRPTGGTIGFRLTGGFLADYGTYALITFAFLAIKYLSGRRRSVIVNVAILLTLLWAVAILLLAQTRSTLMAFVLVCSILLFFGLHGSRRIIWATSLAVFGLLAVFLARNLIWDFLSRGQELEELSTLSGRTFIFAFLMNYWRQSPLIGWGYQAGSRYAAVQFLEETGLYMGAAHDVISKALVDVGLVGALLLGFAFISLLHSLVHLYRRLSREEWLFVVSLAVYGLFASVVGSGVSAPSPVWVVLFIVPALSVAQRRQGGKVRVEIARDPYILPASRR
jgi:O-antigen ligase